MLTSRKAFIIYTVFVAVCVTAVLRTPGPERFPDAGPWYSVLPPLFAVCLAILTGRIMVSLALSVVIGGLLVTVPDTPLSIGAWFGGVGRGASYVYASATDWVNIQILAFVTLILAMIAILIVAGGFHGIVLWLRRFASGSRSTQLVTAIMGLVVFIDDYANTMIVGASMRPVTDETRVSREKLAFLVDATSAPIAGLAVISTWVGYEVGLFNDVSETMALGREGYAMLFDAIFFRFYCVMMIVFVFASVVSGRDYGPMARAERRTQETGAVAEEDAIPMTSTTFSTAAPDDAAKVRAKTAIIPIVVLFLFLLGGIWADGGGVPQLQESVLSIVSPYAWRDVISASENSILLLAYAAGLGLILAMFMAKLLGNISFSVIFRAMVSGMRSSLLPVTILILAWSLKAACDGLSTGPFLVGAVGDVVSPIFFPAVIFIVASLTAFATGTSYGTMAILIPTALPIAYHIEDGAYGLVTILTLASILDGSILGDHCSPISDTTIMSSIASSCDHMHHVRTQLPYSLTVGALAVGVGYIPAALGVPWWVSLITALAIIATLFGVLKRFSVPHAAARMETTEN